MRHDITVTPTEIREAWTTIQTGSNPFSDRQAASATVSRFRDYRSAVVNSFIGASGPEIQHRLEHGHDVDVKDAPISGSEEHTMPTVWLDEEQGDLLIDQVLGGEDLYRVQWTDQAAPKSLTIRANIGMSAGTDTPVISAYMEWILKIADAARRNGAIPTVELVIGTKGGFIASKDQLQVRIPVVNAGEMVDEVSWRAYLAPGAFRSLGFVALAIGADKARRKLNAGMGKPVTTGWNIQFEDDVLSIDCPPSAVAFDEDLMDRMLEEVYR